ncbi:hypothetical protein [Thiocapsa sp.]|uniref:hypothetical protein n=1 Tax=Thiocapsa sp. TaxID=2024551 RepID=UPI0025D0C2E6|nr:hypothetical protein [Thiocapsa sp.]
MPAASLAGAIDASVVTSGSFATQPGEAARWTPTFYIRKVRKGELTTWLFGADGRGATLSASGPYGVFRLRDGDGPIACVAEGAILFDKLLDAGTMPGGRRQG